MYSIANCLDSIIKIQFKYSSGIKEKLWNLEKYVGGDVLQGGNDLKWFGVEM